MTESSSTSGIQNALLDKLSQQYLTQWRNGENPDVEDYVRLHPELAGDIRDLFPAVVFAEQLHAEATDRNLPNPIHQAMHLGPFHLQREIGSGGMGIVYEATQSPFTQKFAVKVLKQKTIKSSALESRFAREAQAVSRLHHPNIVPAKYYGSEAGQNYLVMPLIDGESLEKLLSENASVTPKLQALFKDICNDWQRLAALGAQIASALAHAHSHGMIHRDIKPANLILDHDGKIWVTDFGLAKLCDEESDLSRTGEPIGTPRYMAPEQVLGIADERSDIYSLGLTLYEIVSRVVPSNRQSIPTVDNAVSIERQKQSEKLPTLFGLPHIRRLNPQVPKRLAEVIMRACSHSPRARFQNARELELSLNELSFLGTTERRKSYRSRSIDNRLQVRNIAVLLGMFLILAMCFDLHKTPHVRGLQAQFALGADTRKANEGMIQSRIPEHNQYIYPLTHCITYDEPGTDLVNVVTLVNANSDDAEELGNGEVFLTRSEMQIGGNEVEQFVGLRFAGVEVPAGMEIYSAKLSFYAALDGESKTDLKLFGVDNSNPETFTRAKNDISQRTRTKKSVSWLPSPWTRYELYESPECKEIVQGIVDRPDWKSGNAMAFIIKGKGDRCAISYDEYMRDAACLTIQFKKRVGPSER